MKQIYSINESPINAGDLFLKLLHSGTNGHILHLQTKSYSQHKALETFYNDIIEQTDSLIEAWQGVNGQIAQYPTVYELPNPNALTELTLLSDYFRANRAIVGSQTELQNICDEIQQLIDSTIYKLTFLG